MAFRLGDIALEKGKHPLLAHPIPDAQIVLRLDQMADTHGRIARDIAVDHVAHALFLDKRALEALAGRYPAGVDPVLRRIARSHRRTRFMVSGPAHCR